MLMSPTHCSPQTEYMMSFLLTQDVCQILTKPQEIRIGVLHVNIFQSHFSAPQKDQSGKEDKYIVTRLHYPRFTISFMGHPHQVLIQGEALLLVHVKVISTQKVSASSHRHRGPLLNHKSFLFFLFFLLLLLMGS